MTTFANTACLPDLLSTKESVELKVIGNTIYFTADDGVNGTSLWKTDGTEAGTVMVKDILPIALSSNLSYLTAIGSASLLAQ